jgi:hypothetical protein
VDREQREALQRKLDKLDNDLEWATTFALVNFGLIVLILFKVY